MSPARTGATPLIRRRYYGDIDINAFIDAHPRNPNEADTAYLARVTDAFQAENQYWQRDDVKFLRKRLSGHVTKLVKGTPNNGRTLDAHFNAHVLGDQAGAGWHSESAHADGDVGYSYQNRANIATSKGTYAGDSARIAGVNKAGNNGRTTFFPASMTMQSIRDEATYVANVHHNEQVGQLIRGRGKQTGIMVECLMNGNVVTSAYPFE